MPHRSGEAPGRRPPWWRAARVRAWGLQLALLLFTLVLLGWLAYNTATNIERQGIATGFGFLDQRAGFDIIMHLIPYDDGASYGRAFAVGLFNTLLVSAIGVVLATVIGLVVGLARLSANALIRFWAALYIEVFRNIPLLLQLFFWYFAVLRPLPSPRQSVELGGIVFLNNRGVYLPEPSAGPGLAVFALATGLAVAALVVAWRRGAPSGRPRRVLWVALAALGALTGAVALGGVPLQWEVPRLERFNFAGGLTLIPEFVALLLALSIYTGAFVAEVVRAGVESVGRGQREAAQALGLGRTVALRWVILPQALRVIVPPLTNQYLNLTKNSSLAAAIAYPDLVSVFAGTVLNQTGQALEVIAITAAVYLSISLAIAAAMNLYNRRTARPGM